jgi:hypothetical protein
MGLLQRYPAQVRSAVPSRPHKVHTLLAHLIKMEHCRAQMGLELHLGATGAQQLGMPAPPAQLQLGMPAPPAQLQLGMHAPSALQLGMHAPPALPRESFTTSQIVQVVLWSAAISRDGGHSQQELQ